MEVQFIPEARSQFTFIEGQYLYINCPFLDTGVSPEWHPFTISSRFVCCCRWYIHTIVLMVAGMQADTLVFRGSPGDMRSKDFVSVHIKIMKGGYVNQSLG